MTLLIPVILCGGAGSRLWPVSRELHPKPFMKLADGQSLLQKTLLRAVGLPSVGEVMTVTNRELVFGTMDEYASISPSGTRKTFLLEPFGRNTAAAVAAAAIQAQKDHGDGAILLVLPADHLITDLESFTKAVGRAIELASRGYITTFGIRPTHPETGYGYIEYEGHAVKRFVEKPDAATAAGYVTSGKFLWNSGMFCFSAGSMLAQMAALCPEILSAAQACFENAQVVEGRDTRQVAFAPEDFQEIPENSIDYAVMERTSMAAVVPCDIGWSDIGSWNAISELAPADSRGNRVTGMAILHDTHNCYVQSDRVVGAVGVRDLVVIDTPDALLVAKRSSAQDVKQVFSQLKAAGHDAHKLHRTVHRPWGTYCVLEEGPQFKIKRIEVKPGAALSLQMHRHRSEHWVVVQGAAEVVNGEHRIPLQANQSTYIPAGNKHRLANPGESTLVIIEVQSGSYLGEDDIIRFDDQYGRA